MRILILEDNGDRVQTFYRALVPAHELVVCTHATAAFTLAAGGQWDYIFLDHDLGGEAFVDSRHDNTGAEFCRKYATWLHSCGPATQASCPKIIVHSWNPDGAENMASHFRTLALPEGCVCTAPFGMPDFNQILQDLVPGLIVKIKEGENV